MVQVKAAALAAAQSANLRAEAPMMSLTVDVTVSGWFTNDSYAMALGRIAAALTWSGNRKAQDLVLKFLEHFAGIRNALDEQGLWDDADGMFYDRLITPSGYSVPVKSRSMVGSSRRWPALSSTAARCRTR